MIRIVGICGSLRPESYTRMALNLALAGAREMGVETELIDLKDYQLDFCDGREDHGSYHGDVTKLCQKVKVAQGMILGTPEYHGGYSGVLKNALDLMGFEEFEGKMVGLVGVSGGAMGGLNALNDLRTIGRVLHAWVIPEHAAVPHAWKVFNKDGTSKNEAMEKRLKEVGRQVARFASLHHSQQAMEFLKQWEGAEENPGG
ncbi:MAG: NAD(P)H-dependent oxidoreductase [bacterium]|nr:NAD(P)H-dependent oxidoreductase [bacterium]